MAAPKLTYTILNSQVVPTETPTEIDGETVVIKRDRLYVEAEPEDPMGKLLTLVLPADLADQFPEGATIVGTFTVKEG